jgi:hypothetical protein
MSIVQTDYGWRRPNTAERKAAVRAALRAARPARERSKPARTVSSDYRTIAERRRAAVKPEPMPRYVKPPLNASGLGLKLVEKLAALRRMVDASRAAA